MLKKPWWFHLLDFGTEVLVFIIVYGLVRWVMKFDHQTSLVLTFFAMMFISMRASLSIIAEHVARRD